MPNIVYLNGEWMPRDQARVSVDDRGFLFGDGVYEVLRVVGGRPVFADRHWQRLAHSLGGLEIARPGSIADAALDALCATLIERNALTSGEALIYLEVTRGVAVRTHYFPPAGTAPTVFLSASAFSPPAAIRARGASLLTRPDLRWGRCDLKTVNLLGNVLGAQYAVANGADEVVFVRDGIVTEGGSSNVFGVVKGAIRTHPLGERILGGVTRDVAVEIARELKIPVDETPITLAELQRADEVFITSTTRDVMPVATIDGKKVGAGTSGAITARLYQAFQQRMRA